VSLAATFTLRPSEHFELANRTSGRWLNVDAGGGQKGELFRAGVERLRGTYMFNSRCFLRLIGQYVLTKRNVSLYTFPVPEKNENFSSSALFAYKLNWQTVFYVGYGDDRIYTADTNQMEPASREAFAKVSYAWQQ
jgi:hypothetical protein